MKIRCWGTRGSLPTPGPSTTRYGGNTSCVEVRLHDNTVLILDAGSGIRPLGVALGSCDATLLLSHYHWDHIQGFPFFGPVFSPSSSIRILGPEFEGKGPGAYLSRQSSTPYFPAPPSQWVGLAGFETIYPGQSFSIGTARITVARLSHPSVTLGYRIEEDGESFVYMSDNELDIAARETVASILDLATGADLLLHDCQYTEDEYGSRRGWGHSTPRQAVSLAHEAGVRRLMLFHHDPCHSDEQVESLAEEARRLGGDLPLMIGREGEEIVLEAAVRPAPERIVGSESKRTVA